MKHDLPPPATLTAERIERFDDDADVHALAEAATAAILDGGGFGWVKPPKAALLEQYFRGVLLVPERELIVGRMDGVIYGAVQLHRPSRNNEAQALRGASDASFRRALRARSWPGAADHRSAPRNMPGRSGYQVLNLDVRETQEAAIALYEAAGFIRWGTHPAYARVKGRDPAGPFLL